MKQKPVKIFRNYRQHLINYLKSSAQLKQQHLDETAVLGCKGKEILRKESSRGSIRTQKTRLSMKTAVTKKTNKRKTSILTFQHKESAFETYKMFYNEFLFSTGAP